MNGSTNEEGPSFARVAFDHHRQRCHHSFLVVSMTSLNDGLAFGTFPSSASILVSSVQDESHSIFLLSL